MKKIVALLCLAALALTLLSSCLSITVEMHGSETEETAGTPVSSEPVSSEPAAETKDEKDEKEKELERLLSLTQADAKAQIFDPACDIYLGFESGNFPWEIDWQVTYLTESGIQYSPIVQEGLNTCDDVMNEVRRYFSRAFTEKMVRPELLIDRDGKAWVPAMGKGGNIYFVRAAYELHEKDGAPVYTVTSTFIKDSYLMGIDDYDNIPEEALYDVEKDFTFVWEDGRWVFDTFVSPDRVEFMD